MSSVARTDYFFERIADFAKTSAGGTPKKSNKSFYEGGNIPWLMSGEVASRDITEASNFITQKGLSGSSAKLFPPGSVLVAMYGATAGEVGILRFEAATNQAVCAILPGDKHIPEFIYYYLLSVKSELVSQAIGNAQPNISQAKIKALLVPLPTLNEQERIVAVLDQTFAALDRARSQAESNLNDCETLFEDVRNSIIAEASQRGDLVRLSDVTSIDSKLVDPQSLDIIDLPHLGAGNMLTGRDQLIDVKSAREENLTSGKYLFDSETVLYSKIRPYLRKVARPNFSGLCSADVYPLSASPRLDRNFLFHLLLSSHFTKYAIAGSDRAGMPKVNRKHLFDFEFQLPSYNTQQEAARRIDEVLARIRQVIERGEIKLSAVSQLHESLLQKAFLGELG